MARSGEPRTRTALLLEAIRENRGTVSVLPPPFRRLPDMVVVPVSPPLGVMSGSTSPIWASHPGYFHVAKLLARLSNCEAGED